MFATNFTVLCSLEWGPHKKKLSLSLSSQCHASPSLLALRASPPHLRCHASPSSDCHATPFLLQPEPPSSCRRLPLLRHHTSPTSDGAGWPGQQRIRLRIESPPPPPTTASPPTSGRRGAERRKAWRHGTHRHGSGGRRREAAAGRWQRHLSPSLSPTNMPTAMVGEGLSDSGGGRRRRSRYAPPNSVAVSPLRAKISSPLLTKTDEERVTHFSFPFFIWSREMHVWYGILDVGGWSWMPSRCTVNDLRDATSPHTILLTSVNGYHLSESGCLFIFECGQSFSSSNSNKNAQGMLFGEITKSVSTFEYRFHYFVRDQNLVTVTSWQPGTLATD